MGTTQQARLNGKLSHGPRTKQGKLKAAQNAKKHGLLSSKPPLLETEDLATFEGLVQGLVDHYAPSNPVEWHLVNIVAMSIQKQHRIWMFESAIANSQLIKSEKITDKKYPQYKDVEFPEMRDKTEYHPDNRMDESEMINKLIVRLETREDVPSERSKHFEQDYNIWRRTTLTDIDKLWEWKYNPIVSGLSPQPGLSQEKQLEKISKEFNKSLAQLKKKSPDSYWIALWDMKLALFWDEDKPIPKWRIQSWEDVQHFIAKLTNRLSELETIENEIKQDEIQFKQAKVERENKSKPSKYFDLERLDLLKRYEAHNNRQMYQAIEKLEQLKGLVD